MRTPLAAALVALVALAGSVLAEEMKPAVTQDAMPKATEPKGPAASDDKTKVIKIIAKKFEYVPSEIHLKKGEPVILEFSALDFNHGFLVPDLFVNGKPLQSDLKKGQTVNVRFTPDKAGKFPFHCDNFCGLHHEDMDGEIVVE